MDPMLEWPELNSKSNVFDIGAFEGAWASKIAQKYNPRLYMFEPQENGEHITRLHAAMKGYNYNLFHFALGTQKGLFPMGEYQTDGASFLLGEAHAKDPTNSRKIMGSGQMVDAAEFMDNGAPQEIDLTSMNIEGYEFTLLPYLIERNYIRRFKTLAVQFHTFVENAQAKYYTIAADLERTHTMLWNNYPTWVCWRRKE